MVSIDVHNRRSMRAFMLSSALKNKEIERFVELTEKLPTGSKVHEAIAGLYKIGQFKEVAKFASRNNLTAPIEHQSSQYLARSLIQVGLQGQAVGHSLNREVDEFVNLVLSHYKRQVQLNDPRTEKFLKNAKSENDFIARLLLLGFYAVPIGDEILDELLPRYQYEGRPARLGLRGRKSGLSKKIAFISGAARSGTTALGLLVRSSDKTAIYMELYNAILGYSPEMFDPSNLAHSHFSNNPHFAYNSPLRDRKSDITGDKRPLFLSGWDITKRNFRTDDIRIVHIVRRPEDVMASYEKRRQKACRLEDAWQPDRGSLIAESDLSLQARVIEDIQHGKFATALKVVSFDILTDTDAVLDVFDFLQISIGTNLKKVILDQTIKNADYIAASPSYEPSFFHFLNERELRWYGSIHS